MEEVADENRSSRGQEALIKLFRLCHVNFVPWIWAILHLLLAVLSPLEPVVQNLHLGLCPERKSLFSTRRLLPAFACLVEPERQIIIQGAVDESGTFNTR